MCVKLLAQVSKVQKPWLHEDFVLLTQNYTGPQRTSLHKTEGGIWKLK